MTVNEAIRAEGVVWHLCQQCGQDWPFPLPQGAPNREWICSTCTSAFWARLKRADQERDNIINGLAEIEPVDPELVKTLPAWAAYRIGRLDGAAMRARELMEMVP